MIGIILFTSAIIASVFRRISIRPGPKPCVTVPSIPQIYNMSSSTDRWTTVANAYNANSSAPSSSDPSYNSANTLLAAAHSVHPFNHATKILDIGCGPGTILNPLLSHHGYSFSSDVRIYATDNSPSMVERVRTVKNEKLTAGEDEWNRVDAGVVDAMDLRGVSDDSISHALGGFVFFMVPEPLKALRETHRVLQKDGILALTSWQCNDWMSLCSEVCATVNPAGVQKRVDATLPVPWRSVEGVRGQLEEAGLKVEDVREFECGMGFDDIEKTVRFLVEKVPHFREMIEESVKVSGNGESGKRELEDEMIRRARERFGDRPGRMSGTGIVAVARKV